MKNILTKIKHYEKDLFLSHMALGVEKTPFDRFKKRVCSKLNLLKLNDCDDFKNFKNIEDCFSQKDKIKLELKNKSFRSHTAYTSALKNDLLLNPNLVEAERKFLQAFGMALS
ncbi:hypothetical protein KVK26_01735 [Helicobacter pylori]|nr:hypothetical protein KVK26_01735 [Helicobacter pylori]